MSDQPIAFEAWEKLAEAYSARVETKPHNALYERPAMLSLIPSVNGLRVLDAGCGPGVNVCWLIDQGAEVVGFDASPKMVHLARGRVGDRALIVEGDLSKPLDFLDEASFDLILSSLALDYVADWEPVFKIFPSDQWRVGILGYHPSDDFHRFRIAPITSM
jgi:SAM-dependent methyltransferase